MLEQGLDKSVVNEKKEAGTHWGTQEIRILSSLFENLAAIN
jgi:hypothetical protein